MTNLTDNDIITKVIFPSWKEACSNFLTSETHIFDFWKEACNKFLTSEMYILGFAKEYFDKKKEIEKNCNIKENFNIFTAIAEKYRYENLHSDLLKVILGNKNNNIKNEKIFYDFLAYIDITNPKQYFPNYEDIKFHREYPKGIKTDTKIETPGFIDLLIYTETGKKVCIIIENKINGAPDRPDQLGRYCKMMEEEGIEILKIVYLTIDGKPTEPTNLDDYTPPHDTYVDDIRDKYLIHLLCVSEGNPDIKSFTEFLGQIINNGSIILEDNKKTFIKQYKLLLESIGGKVLMEQYKKEFIKKIMDKREYIQTAEYFANNFKRIWGTKDNPVSELERQLVKKINENDYAKIADDLAKDFKEIWDLRTTIIGELLVDDIEDIAPDMEMVTNDICQKEIYPNVNIYYTYEEPSASKSIEFGFRPTGNEGFDDDLAKKLDKILNSLSSKEIFTFDQKDRGISSNKKWVYLHVKELSSFEYKEIKNKLKECLETLKKEAMNVLPPPKKKRIFVACRPSQSTK